MKSCLVCQAPVEPFISFGRMPCANAYLLPEDFDNEYFFELALAFCEQCYMVQLVNQVDPSQQFNQNYAFISSTSAHMQQHFRSFAHTCMAKYLSTEASPFVLEIGCNDGILLKNFAMAKIRHLGVEPSENVAKLAIDQGLNVISEFFNEQTAKEVAAEMGQAHLICAANVIGHILDLHSVVRGVEHLLSEKGVFVFEHPYLFDNLSKTAYDQIYDEHIYYFSAHSIQNLFNRYGMELIDLEQQAVHGGTMRFTLARKNQYPVSESVSRFLNFEIFLGITKRDIYQQFANRIRAARIHLLEMLHGLKSKNKRIVGYGATAKSSTVLNYCRITRDYLDCIYDVTPTKQNKFSPGMHIPIYSFDEFYKNPPDVALLFAWNHKHEIMQKEKAFMQQGGQWLVYIPEVQLIQTRTATNGNNKNT